MQVHLFTPNVLTPEQQQMTLSKFKGWLTENHRPAAYGFAFETRTNEQGVAEGTTLSYDDGAGSGFGRLARKSKSQANGLQRDAFRQAAQEVVDAQSASSKPEGKPGFLKRILNFIP